GTPPGDIGSPPPYTRLHLPSAANARRSRRVGSSDTRNSFARAVALTGRPRSSRVSISFFLMAPDEPCINKKIPCTIKKLKRPRLSDGFEKRGLKDRSALLG